MYTCMVYTPIYNTKMFTVTTTMAPSFDTESKGNPPAQGRGGRTLGKKKLKRQDRSIYTDHIQPIRDTH